MPILRLPAGLDVHYRARGAGPAVLLLHGLPTSSLDWEPLMGALAGYRCVAPTLALDVGHCPQLEARDEVNGFVRATLDGWMTA